MVVVVDSETDVERTEGGLVYKADVEVYIANDKSGLILLCCLMALLCCRLANHTIWKQVGRLRREPRNSNSKSNDSSSVLIYQPRFNKALHMEKGRWMRMNGGREQMDDARRVVGSP